MLVWPGRKLHGAYTRTECSARLFCAALNTCSRAAAMVLGELQAALSFSGNLSRTQLAPIVDGSAFAYQHEWSNANSACVKMR